MVLGCVRIDKDLSRSVSNELRDIKIKHNLIDQISSNRDHSIFELKWAKISPAKIDYYIDVVNYFFDNENLMFRGVVIPDKTVLDHDAYDQDHDTWYYKMCFRMLEPLIDPDYEHNIYLDIKDTKGEQKRRKLQDVLRNYRHDSIGMIIKRVQQIRSHESEVMQLADLLMGAVCHHNRGLQSSAAKREIIKLVQRRSGKSLCSTTWLRERKFNLLVWDHCAGGSSA
tara:strand:- start:1217 stop:1894 length:678 start_codon:yes stop_codon:yes gene_type:complete